MLKESYLPPVLEMIEIQLENEMAQGSSVLGWGDGGSFSKSPFLIAAVLLSAAFSCQDSLSNAVLPEDEIPQRILFTANSPSAELQITKAEWDGYDFLWTNTDFIGVYGDDAVSTPSTDGLDAKNVACANELTVASSKAVFSGSLYWFSWSSATEASFRAYYPFVTTPDPSTDGARYQEFITYSKPIVTMSAVQEQTGNSNNHLAQYDVLLSDRKTVACAEGIITPSVDFTFRHLCSLVELNLRLTSSSPAAKVERIVIKDTEHGDSVPFWFTSLQLNLNPDPSNVEPDYQFYASHGDVSFGAQAYATLTLKEDVEGDGSLALSSSETFTASMLVLPGDHSPQSAATKNLEIEVTTNLGTVTVQRTGMQFESGKRYHASIELDLSETNIASSYSHADVVKYQSATNAAAEIPSVLVFVGEGFTKDHLTKNTGLYDVALNEAIEAFFAVEPYKTYRDYFDVYKIVAESQDEGADVLYSDGTLNADNAKNTFFQTGWAGDPSSLECDNPPFDFVSAFCPPVANGLVSINDVSIIMVINEDRFTGMTMIYPEGKHYSMVSRFSTNQQYNLYGATYEADWKDVLVHEAGGHGFGTLLDEYYNAAGAFPHSSIEEQSYAVPRGGNLTLNNSFVQAPWYHLYEKGDPYSAKVDKLYEGGNYYSTGVYRSENVSCMTDCRPYFNAYSREIIVKRIMQLTQNYFLESSFLEGFYAKDVTTDPAAPVTPTTKNSYGTIPWRMDPMPAPPCRK